MTNSEQPTPTKYDPELLDQLARTIQEARGEYVPTYLGPEENLAVWRAYTQQRNRRRAIEAGDQYVPEVPDGPEVSALYALAATAKIAEWIDAVRWEAMDDAREDGASYAELGRALGITKQGAADYYRRGASDARLERDARREPPVTVADGIRDAYATVAGAPGDWASLTSIRAALSDVPRAEVDEALRQLALEPGVMFNPDAELTEADRDAALHLNGQAQHLIAIED